MSKSVLIQLSEPNNTDNYAYTVDVTGIEFVENTNTQWIQAMPLGDYTHPILGPIKITVDRVRRFVDNWKAGIRGQDLDIDYEHKTDPVRG